MKCEKCGNAIPENASGCPVCLARANAAASAAAGEDATRPGAPPSSEFESFDGSVPVALAETEKASTDMEIEIPAGTLLVNRFEVVSLLGKGGMGAVYQCRDRQLERTVAMKRLLPKWSGEDWSVQRFLVEAKSVASINHQNVIQVYDIIDSASGKYIVMEYVDGETLATRLTRENKLNVRDTTRIMLQIGMALEMAHRRGVVHRDVKPANIMISAAGIPKLGDFGISQLQGSTDLTSTGTAMGTWVYASPEQLVDAKRVDRRSDIYSVGATMYEMLTGDIPRHISEDKIPEILRPILKKCMMKQPAERFQSAAEFVKALTDSYTRYAENPQAGASVQAGARVNPGQAQVTEPVASHPTIIPSVTSIDAGAAHGSRRRERSMWRARGVAWSCPGSLISGVALLVWAAISRQGVNLLARDGVRSLREMIIRNGLDSESGTSAYTEDVLTFLMGLPYLWIVVALGVMLVVLPAAKRFTTKYRLNSTHLTIKHGLLLKREDAFPLTDFQEVHVSQGIAGMILGYGDIELKRGFDSAVLLKGIPGPSSVRNRITGAMSGQG
jgi:hypothetical protein